MTRVKNLINAQMFYFHHTYSIQDLIYVRFKAVMMRCAINMQLTKYEQK